jgi:hypothetical protein
MIVKLKQTVVESLSANAAHRKINDTFDIDRRLLIENAARKQTVIDLVFDQPARSFKQSTLSTARR